MPKALLDIQRCQPDQCAEGQCAVRKVCSVRAISQEEPFDPPMVDWARCRACSKCVAACPLKALSLVN